MALVDVIIPTRNRLALTLETVRSVQAQTLTDWHLWIVDDGSDDGSGDALAATFADNSRVTVRRISNTGPQRARVAVEQLGEAPWVALCDSDDLWFPTKLERQLVLGDEADLVLCWHEWFRPDGTVRSTSRPMTTSKPSVLLSNNMSTPLIRREFLRSIGGLGPPDGLRPTPSCDNTELYLRLLAHGRVAVVPDVLVRCRDHAGERTSDGSSSLRGAEDLEAVLRHHADLLRDHPSENALLWARAGARMVEAGRTRAGLGHLSRGTAMAPSMAQRASLVKEFGPFVVKSLGKAALRRGRSRGSR